MPPWWATRINTLSHLAQCMMVPIMDAENVELLANTEIRELMREDRLGGVMVEDNRSGARRTLGARALFVFIGAPTLAGSRRPSNPTNAASS